MSADLWDWRRQIADLYAGIRAAADPAAAWRGWVAARDRLFHDHPQSPLPAAERALFRGLPYFDYDPTARLRVALAPAAEAQLDLEIGRDGRARLTRFARTDGLAARFGGELDVWWIDGYGGGAFLSFLDATSGKESYGGGRYLLDTIKGADLGREGGRVVLDFNFAYQPSCAYSSDWVCPLPPASNRLPAPVRAGERVSS
jgi:uncharacterized protein (DUF1684 family)